MGDLQCPARVFVAADDGRLAVPELTERLWAERIAVVYTGPGDADQAGRDLAGTLGARFSQEPRLSERLAEVLGEIADGHRGEAVLVLASPDVAVALTGSTRASGPLVALEADGDGWRRVRPPSPPASGQKMQ